MYRRELHHRSLSPVHSLRMKPSPQKITKLDLLLGAQVSIDFFSCNYTVRKKVKELKEALRNE